MKAMALNWDPLFSIFLIHPLSSECLVPVPLVDARVKGLTAYVKDPAQDNHSLSDEQNIHRTFMEDTPLARFTMNNSDLRGPDTLPSHLHLRPLCRITSTCEMANSPWSSVVKLQLIKILLPSARAAGKVLWK